MPTGGSARSPLSEALRSPALGTVIAGKYRLEALLGRGGMAMVYAACHIATGRRFAVKLLGRALRADALARERFLREARLASSIQHPAIVEVYDVGCDDGQPYMVMRLLQGETLSRRIDERGPLPPPEAIALLLPVVEAIAAAHASGVVHRDLKPDNVMIEREGERELPRVLDFGISKPIRPDARRLTHPGALIGTPEYMAPEQVRGEADLDARTDVYALGVMLYEMLTGALPYDAEDCASLLRAVAVGGAPGVRAHRPELPVELEAIVARAMSRERAGRHADAGELARDLARFEPARAAAPARRSADLAPHTPTSLTPFAASVGPRPARASRAPRYAAIFSAALAAGIALAWLTAAPSPQPPQAAASARVEVSAVVPHGAAVAPLEPLTAVELPAAAPHAAHAPVPQVSVERRSRAPAASATAVRPARARKRDRAPRSPHAAQRVAELGVLAAADIADAGAGAAHAGLPSVTSELLDPFQ